LHLSFILHLILLVPAPLVYLWLRKPSNLSYLSTCFFSPIWIYQQLLFHISYFLWAFTVSSPLYFALIILICFTLNIHTWLILRSQKMTNLFFLNYLLIWLWFSQSFILFFKWFNHFDFILKFNLELFTLNRWIKCFLLNVLILLFISIAFNVIDIILWRKLIFNIYIAWSINSLCGALLKFPFLYTCKIHIDLITAIFLATKLIFLCYNCVVITGLKLHILN
jgi:hypothetical protein